MNEIIKNKDYINLIDEIGGLLHHCKQTAIK